MEDKTLLVEYKSNWADEIDIEGYSIMKESDYFEMLKKVEYLCLSDKNEHYIGTNETIFLGTEDFNYKYITKTQEKILRETIIDNEKGFIGFFPLDFILDNCIDNSPWEIIYLIYENDYSDEDIGEDKKGKYYICNKCGEKIYNIYDNKEYHGNYCPVCKCANLD